MKPVMMIAIGIVVLGMCCCQPQLLLAEEPVIVTVRTDASAPIIDGNVERSRSAAIRQAYAEAALRDEAPETADMATPKALRNLSDIVASRSRGLVKSYVIVNEGISERDNDLYTVTIEAVVVERGEVPPEEEGSLKLYLELLNSPRLLILIAEDDGRQSPDPARSDDAATTLRPFETALAHSFNYYGYQVVTSDDLVARHIANAETLSGAKAGVTAKAVEVARAAQADLALIGKIRYASDKTTVQQVELTTVTAEISLKALIVSSGTLIDAMHHKTQASFPRELGARSDCTDRAARDISQHLAWKIPQMLSINLRETDVRVTNIDSAQAMALRNFLSRITGVDSIRINQLPTNDSDDARFVIVTGFIAPEAGDIVYHCTKSLDATVKLIESDKYMITLAIQPE